MEELSNLRQQLETATDKNQLQILDRFVNSDAAGLEIVTEFLLSRQDRPINLAIAKAYQILYQSDSANAASFLQSHYPNGIVPLKSDRQIDYSSLQQALARQKFQDADTITRQKLCELAGEAAIKRKWVYFTEVEQFPQADLSTLDRLWFFYSEGKFGFSVQREIWLSLGKDFSKLWTKIGWKNEVTWTRYPNEFIWDLTAPKGHLPLSNQLRGVREIAALFAHPVWLESSKK
jgi:hypothetical protein